MTRDSELVTAIAEDWRTAPVDERQRALLAYADRLTRDPAAMRSSDVPLCWHTPIV